MKIQTVLTLFCMLFSSPANSSQEGALKFSSFTIESSGIGQSGPVVVQASTNKKNVLQSLSVTFQAKRVMVPDELIKSVPPFINGVMLSYEEASSERAAAVYLSMLYGFAASTDITKVVIEVLANGDCQIIDLDDISRLRIERAQEILSREENMIRDNDGKPQ